MNLFRQHNLNQLKKLCNGQVYFGPFAGMKIPAELYKVLTVSELLGLYESCLHPVFSDLCNRKMENIALVGGNNGYYAAGLSYLYRPKNFLVYETVPQMHDWIKSWFDVNKVPAPHILGEANESNFNDPDLKVDFLLIDCEGGESQLLNPSVFHWQKNADILVELHPFYAENITGETISRFRNTHNIQMIYDDFGEDQKVVTILKGLGLEITYPKHPTHRWILVEGKKVFTSGIFMFLKHRGV